MLFIFGVPQHSTQHPPRCLIHRRCLWNKKYDSLKEVGCEGVWVGKLHMRLAPDPVHHEGGAVLEDAEVFFLHALRGIQEQVQVQVTRSLDLDFPAHAFWEKYRGWLVSTPDLLSCQGAQASLAVSSALLCPAEAEPRAACPADC